MKSKRPAIEIDELADVQNLRRLTCQNCHRRKVKCDRSNPCNHCTRRHEECVWLDAIPLKQKALDFQENQVAMKNEITRLQFLVKEFGKRLGVGDGELGRLLGSEIEEETFMGRSRSNSNPLGSPALNGTNTLGNDRPTINALKGWLNSWDDGGVHHQFQHQNQHQHPHQPPPPTPPIYPYPGSNPSSPPQHEQHLIHTHSHPSPQSFQPPLPPTASTSRSNLSRPPSHSSNLNFLANPSTHLNAPPSSHPASRERTPILNNIPLSTPPDSRHNSVSEGSAYQRVNFGVPEDQVNLNPELSSNRGSYSNTDIASAANLHPDANGVPGGYRSSSVSLSNPQQPTDRSAVAIDMYSRMLPQLQLFQNGNNQRR